jgi:hypothetical protein
MPFAKQALSPTKKQVAQVATDIREAAPTDAVIDAKEAFDAAHAIYTQLCGLKFSLARAIFGESGWWAARNAAGAEVTRCHKAWLQARRDAGLAAGEISLDDIARPVSPGASVRYTGD